MCVQCAAVLGALQQPGPALPDSMQRAALHVELCRADRPVPHHRHLRLPPKPGTHAINHQYQISTLPVTNHGIDYCVERCWWCRWCWQGPSTGPTYSIFFLFHILLLQPDQTKTMP